MFTGIVQGTARVLAMSSHNKADRFCSLRIQFPAGSLEDIAQGASIALNGVCLTVTDFDLPNATACFDVIRETLDVTNLSALAIGDEVNFERAARIGDEIGGHLMSGHVIKAVRIRNILKSENNVSIELEAPKDLHPYLLNKGFIGLNGCSLTVGEVNQETFVVHLIPETLTVTTFGTAKTGDLVNLEIDPQTHTIVDTVTRILSKQKQEGS